MIFLFRILFSIQCLRYSNKKITWYGNRNFFFKFGEILAYFFGGKMCSLVKSIYSNGYLKNPFVFQRVKLTFLQWMVYMCFVIIFLSSIFTCNCKIISFLCLFKLFFNIPYYHVLLIAWYRRAFLLISV